MYKPKRFKQNQDHSRPAYKGSRRGNLNSRPSRNSRKSENISHLRFIKSATLVEQKLYIPTNKFADFDLHKTLKANIAAKGFEQPSQIQDHAIPVALRGKDVVGISNTGTGKTIAFLVPVLNKILSGSSSKVLIMTPTRELAQQVETESRMLGKGSGIRGALLIGGSSMSNQLRQLRFKPTIVIGTPGRIKDHLERGSLNLSDFDCVVLDEVDRMLDMGFVNDMRAILSKMTNRSQSLFFSATVDQKVERIINDFSKDPVTINAKSGETTDNVEQDIVKFETADDKFSKLHDLLISDLLTKTIIFDETQRNVDRLNKDLRGRGFKADSIHGGKSQGQRQRALRDFKKNNIDILVATDVAARGIDISDITHVINYSVPQTYDDYVHRIGRAGRAGKKGYSLTFVPRRST